MKKLICALSLLNSVSYASSGTLIFTTAGEVAVQCNNWGWAKNMFRTFWPEVVCAPLLVKLPNGDVFSIATTDVCDGVGDAIYSFTAYHQDPGIVFHGCAKMN